MNASDLRARLAAVPRPEVPVAPSVVEAVAHSERYLASDEALRSLAVDVYWPKWDSPWWHMVQLFEMGEARRIPVRARDAMVAALDAMPVKIFPIHPGDCPPGVDIMRETSCHCALGTMSQVLVATGVDVDRVLPWIEPWFVRYQMSDGGLTCDNDAYLVTDQCPSSMVGTIGALEAMLVGNPESWSEARRLFVARAAAFVLGREARLGSSSTHNADERTREAVWPALCFPRFYLYDVLRGVTAIARWAERCGGSIPAEAIVQVVDDLCTRFPDGVVRAGRQSFAGVKTRALNEEGVWVRQAASTSPLLEAISDVDLPSPWLTRAWADTRQSLIRSIDDGRVSAASGGPAATVPT